MLKKTSPYKNRTNGSITPGMTKDSRLKKVSRDKRAIIVEGGGFRGAFAVGVFKYLKERYGDLSYFDAIYAVSSGVFASSYFLSGQVQEMEDTWLFGVDGNKILNWQNPLSNRQFLDLDKLIRIFQGKIPINRHNESQAHSVNVSLNCETLASTHTQLYFVVTDFYTGQPKYVNISKSLRNELGDGVDCQDSSIFDYMMASSSWPGLYRSRVEVDGRRLIDGGLSDPLPLFHVLNKGYSDITVVLNLPNQTKKRRASCLASAYYWPSPASAYGPIRHAYRSAPDRYNEALSYIKSNNMSPHLTVIQPDFNKYSQLDTSRSILELLIHHGYQKAKQVVSEISPPRDFRLSDLASCPV